MPITTDGESATWTGTFPNGFVQIVPGGAQWSTIIGATASLSVPFNITAIGELTPYGVAEATLTVPFTINAFGRKPVGGRFALPGGSENGGGMTLTQNGGRLE